MQRLKKIINVIKQQIFSPKKQPAPHQKPELDFARIQRVKIIRLD
jgi:hypothetical protein